MEIAFLIDKQLRGIASADEIEQIQKWVAQGAKNAAEYEDLKSLLLGTQTPMERPDPNPEFLQGLAQIKKKISEKQVEKKKIRHRNYSLLAFTAVTITILCLWLTVNTLYSHDRKDLHFNSTPLKEVIEQLQQTYGVSIDIDSADIFACRFTGIFFGSYAAHDIVRSVAAGTNLKSEQITSTHFKLTGTGCR